VASRPVMQIDPDVGIPDLVRRLTEDSKRLANDEVRLAKLEMRENIHTGGRGALWLGLAFGAGVVALVALTFTLIAVVGRLAQNYWAGALIVGVVELGLAYWLVKRGLNDVKQPSYTFEESREELKETAAWVKSVR
jgi:uncharacterized membrane protein YqjE